MNWFLRNKGVTLHINNYDALRSLRGRVVALDVEDDGTDDKGFVGLAICPDPNNVYYYTELTSALRSALSTMQFIGHYFKSDLASLRAWGIPLSPDQIYADTIIMAYCQNPARESFSLKDIAIEKLGLTWPTYKEMVKDTGTLKGMDTELVANYCGMDAYATLRIFHHLLTELQSTQKNIYTNLELPVYRLLIEMEQRGVRVDVPKIEQLDKRLEADITAKEAHLSALVPSTTVTKGKRNPKEVEVKFNPNSPAQVVTKLFPLLGIKEKSSDSKKVLVKYARIPEIVSLMEFRKLTKLRSTYTKSMLDIPTLPFIHTSFNQVNGANMDGIDTTRLSSSNPNLQNIPAEGEYGELLRSVFLPNEGFMMGCADFSQIEYRLMAHVSGEPLLLDTFRNGGDVHEVTGRMFGVNRRTGKTLNFMAIYGGGADKASMLSGLPVAKCEELMREYWQRLPNVSRWTSATKYFAHKNGGVATPMGRFIPLAGINSQNRAEMHHYERAAVNYVIQGGAAEIMKIAMLRLRGMGIVPLLTVHDELVFNIKHPSEMEAIKSTMENSASLRVPLIVNTGVGSNWNEAKPK